VREASHYRAHFPKLMSIAGEYRPFGKTDASGRGCTRFASIMIGAPLGSKWWDVHRRRSGSGHTPLVTLSTSRVVDVK
jgi:hypothetical protein